MTTTTDRPRPGSGQRRGPQGRSAAQPATRRIPDEDVELANAELPLAFQLAGLVSGGGVVCPICSASKKKVQLKTNESGKPYWKCHKCGKYGSAVKLLQDHAGYSFPDAVNVLLGRPTSGNAGKGPVKQVEAPAIVVEPPFRAVVDVEVYDAVRDAGSLEEAQRYWALVAHVEPGVVAEAGSTYVVDARALAATLTEAFGMERLRAAGVVKSDDGKDRFLVNAQYCVVEPHERACSELRADWARYAAEARAAREAGSALPVAPFKPPPCTRADSDPHGHVVGMQFRPSFEQKARVDAHKAWKRRWSGFTNPETGAALEPDEAWANAREHAPRTTGEKARFVTPFLSIRGATPESLVGCGLRRVAELPAGAFVYNVEGFKDYLAARTMGAEAYAIPGTGVLPSDKTCALLRRHTQVVSLDGDAAGAKGRDALMEHYAQKGVPARVKPNIREGLDVADILNERRALEGHQCPTCDAWREAHAQ